VRGSSLGPPFRQLLPTLRAVVASKDVRMALQGTRVFNMLDTH
jgi:hypothetical protein